MDPPNPEMLLRREIVPAFRGKLSSFGANYLGGAVPLSVIVIGNLRPFPMRGRGVGGCAVLIPGDESSKRS